MLQGKKMDEFLPAENLLVAVGPTQPGQIVDHGLGQVAYRLVVQDRARRRGAWKAWPGPGPRSGACGRKRRGDVQGLIDEDLPGGVGDGLFTPDDMGDRHGDVIHHYREVIGGNAVTPLKDQVVEFGVVEGDGGLWLGLPSE